MSALNIKAGDTYPPISANLTDSSGASAIDLTTASGVHLELQAQSGGTRIASLGCTIPSLTLGYVKHAWNPTETAMPDTWTGEFKINWASPSGAIQTVPNNGTFSIVINPPIEET